MVLARMHARFGLLSRSRFRTAAFAVSLVVGFLMLAPSVIRALPRQHEGGGARTSAQLAFETALESDPRTSQSFLNATGIGVALSPECPKAAGDATVALCIAEYEYKGSVYVAEGTVRPAQIHNYQRGVGNTGTIGSVTHWSRHWRVCRAAPIPGRLTGNLPGCEQILIRQYFEYAGKVTYTFKPYLFIIGTGSGYWPDFNLFNCEWRHKTYRCSTRVGDAFRWQPFA